mmetsp:Transcript_14116/g.21353  ORF Transcript_14116/g.21353 Transcript_14116/m.21353 type:complete len:265 (+) Transcript_14116:309-1103(+)
MGDVKLHYVAYGTAKEGGAIGFQRHVQSPANKKKIDNLVDAILLKVVHDSHDRTLTKESFSIHYRVKGNHVVVVIAHPDYKIRRCQDCFRSALADIEALGVTAQPRDIKAILKHYRKFYNDPKNDKVTATMEKAERVRDQMEDTVNMVLQRGDDLDILEERAEEVKNTASVTAKKSKTIKKQTQFIFIILLAIFIFVMIAITAVVWGIYGFLIALAVCTGSCKGICSTATALAQCPENLKADPKTNTSSTAMAVSFILSKIHEL